MCIRDRLNIGYCVLVIDYGLWIMDYGLWGGLLIIGIVYWLLIIDY